MNPYLEIRNKYISDFGEQLLTWEELVGFHLADKHCYVMKGPDYFVMGRAITRSASAERIRDLTAEFPAEECDTWFLYAFAGNMTKALNALPYDLPWMAWDRFNDPDGDMRFMPLSAIRRLCGPSRRACA